MTFKRIWSIYAKSIGIKPEGLNDREADLACIFRTLIFTIPAICIIANCGRTFGIW